MKYLIIPIITRILIGIVLVMMIAVGITFLLLWKKQDVLVQQALAVINTQFTGVLTVQGAHVAPFRQFPYISIDLKGVRFFTTRDTSVQPLYNLHNLYVGFNALDLWNGEYKIKSLTLEGGRIDIQQWENGKINLLVAKGWYDDAPSNSVKSENFDIDLQRLVVNNLDCTYHDIPARRDIVSHIERFNASFTLNDDIISTRLTTALVLDIDQNGEHTFFNNKHIICSTELQYNTKRQYLTFLNTLLGLEKAEFRLDGTVDIADSMNADIRFSGEKPSLNTFAAFAPPAIQEALERYNNEGKITFSGVLHGKLAGAEMPSYRVDFACENARVVNRAVNKRVEEIYFSGMITNGESRSMKTSEFRLMDIRATPEVGIFRGNIIIRNFDDPYVNVNINADVDLEFLAAFLGAEGLKRLKGQIVLNMNFNELVDMDNPDETLVRLKEGIDSELRIKNLTVLVPNYPHPITNINGYAVMKKGFITMDDLSFRIADSDIRFDGTLSDFPALFHATPKPIEITLNAHARHINIPQLLQHDSARAQRFNEEIHDLEVNCAFFAHASDLRNFCHLPKGEFFIRNISAQFKNYPHRLHDIRADILIDERTLTVKDVSGVLDGSDIHCTASLENYGKWFEPVKRGVSTFSLALRSERFAFNDILSYQGRNYVPKQYRTEEVRGFALDAGVTIHFDSAFRFLEARVNKLTGSFALHGVNLRDGKGRVRYENGWLDIEGLSAGIGKSALEVRAHIPLETSYSQAPQSTPHSNASEQSALSLIYLTAERLDMDELLLIQKRAMRLKNGGSSANTSSTPSSDTSSEAAAHHHDTNDHKQAFNIFRVPFPNLKLSADVRRLKYGSLRAKNVVARLRLQSNHYCYLDTLGMETAGGALVLNGYFNGSDSERIYLSTQLTAQNIDLKKILLRFDNFGQDKLVSDNITGTVSGSVKGMFFVYPDLTPVIDKSEAEMDVMIVRGELLNFAPIQAMSRFLKDKNLNRVRFDTLRNTLHLRNGALHIPAMTINSSLGYIELSGEQHIERSRGFALDYTVGVPWSLITNTALRNFFGGTQRDSLSAEHLDSIQYRSHNAQEALLKFRIHGAPGAFDIGLGGK